MRKFFAGEYILKNNSNKIVNFSTLPIVDYIRSVANKFKDCLELMPVQIEGRKVELQIAVYLDSLDSSQGQYILVINRGLYPNSKSDLIQFVRNGLNNLKLFKGEGFSNESYRSSIKTVEDLIQYISK